MRQMPVAVPSIASAVAKCEAEVSICGSGKGLLLQDYKD